MCNSGSLIPSLPVLPVLFLQGFGVFATKVGIKVEGNDAATSVQISESDLKNILTLRSFADSDAIIAAAEGAKRAVVNRPESSHKIAVCGNRIYRPQARRPCWFALTSAD